MQKMEKATKQDDLKETVTAETNSKDERVKEKVVYKVVPVPYYYPVPVDAEWYYKHHEPPMRNGERGFHGYPDDPSFDNFPFPPPPAHGFPGPPRSALREQHYYSSSRDDDERYLRPVSPLYRHISSRGSHYSPPSSGARKPKENGEVENVPGKGSNENKDDSRNGDDNEENLSPRSPSVKSEQNESENEENKRNGEFGSQSDGDASRSDKEDDHAEDKTSNSDSEVSRKRKRFPMTFPYDQRKKILKETSLELNGEKPEHTNGHVEDINETSPGYKRRTSEESEGRVYSSHKYSTNGSTPNGHYPYVMVPLRSPPYADVRPSPRYTERSHSYYESRLYDDAYPKETSPGSGRGDLKSDDKREIRYHPNGRRARTVFTRQQLLTLNNVFEKHPFVSGERMSELSDQLGLDRKIVKIWFQNKRQYARKKGSLVERSDEYYYDYQDSYNPTSAPPSMAAERWKAEN